MMTARGEKYRKTKTMSDTTTSSGTIGGLYWLFSLVYTFMVWNWGWAILSIFFPIFPLIDLVKYIIAHR